MSMNEITKANNNKIDIELVKLRSEALERGMLNLAIYGTKEQIKKKLGRQNKCKEKN